MNIREFAKRIGVSTAAVSYAINGKEGHISTETREKILRAMGELGYRPNRLARALATRQARIIAMWTFDVYPPYYTHAIYHVRQLLNSEGFELIIVEPSAFDPASPSRWPVEGIIAYHKDEVVRQMLDAGSHYGIPLVDMGVGCLTSVDHVRVNTRTAAAAAVRHLVSSGRRRIAYLLPDRVREADEERCQAYREVIGEAGLSPELIYYASPVDSLDRLGARTRMREVARSGALPDAIVGYDDETAIGAFKGLREAGIRIPGELAIIGCDGIADTEYLDPALSTIVQPVEAMCRQAWEFLKRRMSDPATPLQARVLDARLDIRGTS